MNNHWTARSTEDFRFRIAADFIVQLENKMESVPLTQKELAKKLGLSKGRISQFLNKPGNLTLKKIVEYSRALDMKVAIVAYEDGDNLNKKGPINPEIFKLCWEKSGKPHEFWVFQEISEQSAVDSIGNQQQYTTMPTTAANVEIAGVRSIKETLPVQFLTPIFQYA